MELKYERRENQLPEYYNNIPKNITNNLLPKISSNNTIDLSFQK